MTTIVEQLTNACDLEKKAYFEYVKSFSSAGITALTKGGLPLEKASEFIKIACQNDGKAIALKTNAAIFEKTSAYIKSMEEELKDLQKFAQEIEQEKKIEESTPMSKLANIGFTKEELTYMSSLPENLVTKVASIGSKPWEMGSGVGMVREKTDPLLEFILS
jgi:hypothetical protein